MLEDTGALVFSEAMMRDSKETEDVLRRAFASYVRQLGREQTTDAYKWLPTAIKKGRVYVVRSENQIMGAVVTSRQDGELVIDQIAVAPDFQRSGLGSWLLSKVEEAARAKEIEALRLDTAEIMDHLLRLYRRHGFEVERRGLPEHGKDAHVRVYMRKQL